MAWISSKADKKAVPLAEFGREVLARRAAAGDPAMPRNSGANRTESKKALLTAIDEAAAKKGFRW
ncbi:MAG: hypothetical protein H0X36_08410 [Sphingomonadaceae bacterium]|nr:hypothetical protein [Sphingomonadaceae bacterium]